MANLCTGLNPGSELSSREDLKLLVNLVSCCDLCELAEHRKLVEFVGQNEALARLRMLNELVEI